MRENGVKHILACNWDINGNNSVAVYPTLTRVCEAPTNTRNPDSVLRRPHPSHRKQFTLVRIATKPGIKVNVRSGTLSDGAMMIQARSMRTWLCLTRNHILRLSACQLSTCLLRIWPVSEMTYVHFIDRDVKLDVQGDLKFGTFIRTSWPIFKLISVFASK